MGGIIQGKGGVGRKSEYNLYSEGFWGIKNNRAILTGFPVGSSL